MSLTLKPVHAALTLGCVMLVSAGLLGAERGAAATQPVSSAGRFIFKEGARLVERAGRIVSYETDAPDAPQTRVRYRDVFITSADGHEFILLENEESESLRELVREGRTELRPTGIITRYRNQNYLLVARTGEAPAAREHTRLIDRAGTVVSYEVDVLGAPRPRPWHRSAFIASADDRVYILLENTRLERLEDFTRRGEAEVRVSGTAMRCRGRDYLFLTRTEQRPVERGEEPW